MEPLDKYRRKRNFGETPEPQGDTQTEPGEFPRFVVQEHHSRRLHWDFRLERDGVLKSWAVPKGVPLEPGVRRLAVEVEDHPLDYITFEGEIPAGQYGAGTVTIWDKGRYAAAEWAHDKIVVAMLGEKLNGGYHLVRTSGDQWLLFKGKEEVESQPDSDNEGPGRDTPT